jgi:hypothetical protein
MESKPIYIVKNSGKMEAGSGGKREKKIGRNAVARETI